MSESRMGRGDQIHPGKKTHVVNLPKIDLGDPPPPRQIKIPHEPHPPTPRITFWIRAWAAVWSTFNSFNHFNLTLNQILFHLLHCGNHRILVDYWFFFIVWISILLKNRTLAGFSDRSCVFGSSERPEKWQLKFTQPLLVRGY